MLHWAYELSAADFESGARRVKTHGAYAVQKEQLEGIMSRPSAKKRKADEKEEKLPGRPTASYRRACGRVSLRAGRRACGWA